MSAKLFRSLSSDKFQVTRASTVVVWSLNYFVLCLNVFVKTIFQRNGVQWLFSTRQSYLYKILWISKNSNFEF